MFEVTPGVKKIHHLETLAPCIVFVCLCKDDLSMTALLRGPACTRPSSIHLFEGLLLSPYFPDVLVIDMLQLPHLLVAKAQVVINMQARHQAGRKAVSQALRSSRIRQEHHCRCMQQACAQSPEEILRKFQGCIGVPHRATASIFLDVGTEECIDHGNIMSKNRVVDGK